jgi:hypothetical protein
MKTRKGEDMTMSYVHDCHMYMSNMYLNKASSRHAPRKLVARQVEQRVFKKRTS